MNDWRLIDVPIKMKHLPKDKRGYPIPFTIWRDRNGVPNFRQHDDKRLAECIINKQCSICGNPLNSEIWLLAGVKVALTPMGGYIDPAMHEQCATYALKVCPYLALPSFSKRPGNRINELDPVEVLSGRPTVFALVKTFDYKVHSFPHGTIVLMPVRPFIDIQFWKEGEQISEREVNTYLK